MAARAKKDPGTAKPKYRYQVMNWAEYDRALVSRGDLTIWFDEATIREGWTPPPPVGRGKPGLYSALAIQTCLTLKTLFRLPYRATEGLMKSLMRLVSSRMIFIKTIGALWSLWAKGRAVGKSSDFSTASAPVRRRRIVHKSTASFPQAARRAASCCCPKYASSGVCQPSA